MALMPGHCTLLHLISFSVLVMPAACRTHPPHPSLSFYQPPPSPTCPPPPHPAPPPHPTNTGPGVAGGGLHRTGQDGRDGGRDRQAGTRAHGGEQTMDGDMVSRGLNWDNKQTVTRYRVSTVLPTNLKAHTRFIFVNARRAFPPPNTFNRHPPTTPARFPYTPHPRQHIFTFLRRPLRFAIYTHTASLAKLQAEGHDAGRYARRGVPSSLKRVWFSSNSASYLLPVGSSTYSPVCSHGAAGRRLLYAPFAVSSTTIDAVPAFAHFVRCAGRCRAVHRGVLL